MTMKTTIPARFFLAALCLAGGAAGRSAATEVEITGNLRVESSAGFGYYTLWGGASGVGVSEAGQGIIYFDSSLNSFRFSENGAAFRRVQYRVAGTCSVGDSIKSINSDGTVVCNTGIEPGLIVISTGSCLSGFQELMSFAGRFPKGTPAGGSAGGTYGTPMTDQGLQSHTHLFTPSGSVGSPVFTGTPGTADSESGHTHSFTPAGSVSGTLSGGAGTTDSGGSDHTHTTGGPSDTVSAYFCPTGISYAASGHTHTTGGASVVPHTHGFTPAGSVSGTLTGGAGTTGAGSSHTHSFTPAGSVSAPEFTGTQAATGSGDGAPPYIQVRFCMKL